MTGPSLPSVDTVLRTLRRGARHPRESVEAAVQQLLQLGRSGGPARASDGTEPRRTYRIDDLAHTSGVTVRNIRAYQERGLLPPPQRVGRTAFFDDSHLTRLRIISSMLERGYTAANTREILHAWENGHDLGTLLGLESALVPPAVDEPVSVTTAEARRRAGGTDELALITKAGLAEQAGAKVRLLRPRLLESFAEMRAYGMSTGALLEVYSRVDPAVDDIARTLVRAGTEQLAPRFFADGVPSSDSVGELVELLTRFRSLAMTAVTSSVAVAVEREIERVLADYLSTILATEDDAGA